MKFVEKKITVGIIFGVIFIGIFLLTPWRMTPQTLSLIFSIFSVESIEPESIRQEVYVYDETTKFYIFRSYDEKVHPGIVISLGVHPLGAEDENLQKIFNGLVKNGFVVLTIDSTLLKNSIIDSKEVGNLVEGFRFLAEKPYVDSNKIGFMGLSTGSPLAFLAAANSTISENVKYILWSGGYFDASELIIDVLSESFVYEGKVISWEPSARIQEVVFKNLDRWAQKGTLEENEPIEKIKNASNREELKELLENLPPHIRQILENLSLPIATNDVSAPVFIFHGKADTLIPFSHSINLFQSYKGEKKIVLSERYGHEAPRLSWRDLFYYEFWQVVSISNQLLA